jgi:drug/metabolite transporter (DMT)-like permease
MQRGADSASTAPDARARVLLAVLWMCGALVSFTLIAIAGRSAAQGLDTLQITVWRSIIGSAVMCLIVVATGARFGTVATPQLRLHSLRALIHLGAQFSWLYALTRMPLAELFALEFTAPLWVAVLAPLLIGEKLSLPRIGAVALGFIGILVVVRPGTVPIGEGTPFGIACAIGFALSMVATKRLLRTDSAFTTLFWMQSLQVAMGLAVIYAMLALGHGTGLVIPDAVTFGWVAAVGILGLTAHYSLAKAFTFADAIVVAPMDFLRLPLIAVVGLLLYAEPLDPWVLGGGLIVVMANFLNIQGERRQRIP